VLGSAPPAGRHLRDLQNPQAAAGARTVLRVLQARMACAAGRARPCGIGAGR